MPKFSVLVPAYNEQESIKDTLNSIVNLDYPKDLLQVIVINDGSKDNTRNIIEDFISKHPHNDILLINQNNQGKGNALNNGLKHTTGEFFALMPILLLLQMELKP